MSSSSNNSPISELITPLKSTVPRQIFDRVHSDLTLKETVFKNEKTLLLRKIHNTSIDRDVLDKELRQMKRDYGELLLRESDNSVELSELRRESAELKNSLNSFNAEAQKLKAENESKTRQLTESRLALKQLKNSSSELSAEVEKLRVENEDLRRKIAILTVLEKENVVMKARFEKEKEVKEEIKKEKDKLENDYGKVKRARDGVIVAATIKFKGFEKRIEVLEAYMAKLNSLGEKTVSITPEVDRPESLKSDEKHEGPVRTQSVCGTAPCEENSASSFSCPQGQGVNTISKGLVRCKTLPSVAEKAGSSKPYNASHVICISDSDDDGESKGLKRKLEFTDSPVHSKTSLTTKMMCNDQTDIEVESVKQWEYEADMIEDMEKEKNIETCMKAVCGLYRQHTIRGRSKGFSDIDAFRGMTLGKFLADGDINGGLKKSLADLVDYDTNGTDKCRRLAIAHSSRLFEIYKNKEDPHFGPPN